MDTKPPYVRVDPTAETWLTISPGQRSGEYEASTHRARLAQQAEREAAIADATAREGLDLLRQEALDSLERERVAKLLPGGWPLLDRRDAAAVAIRLHEPRWQMVSRYYAADAILVELRKFLHDGHGYATDTELRTLADSLAGISHTKRLAVWTGQIGITARTWTRAALGLLNLTEEQ